MKNFKKNDTQTSLEGSAGQKSTAASGPKKSLKSKLKWPLLILAILLALSATAFAGYKYAKSESKEPAPASEEPKDEATKSEEKRLVVRDLVGPEPLDYRVELPSGWVKRECADNPDIFFLAPTTDSLGKCQTEYFGTVSISKLEGDQRRTEEYYAADDAYRSPAYTAVTIDYLPGYRISYSTALESELGYPPLGTFEYFYNLYNAAENVTYKIGYRQLPDDADYQAQFVAIAESFDKI